ncbi:hypothetical protein GUJ93_ZPchr0001g30852 [Zizania palustris]|uniref:RWP-RK domain-containing protein n=1 Tax=Zizania palustris TaxID=103762 RepID=A0A8J5RMQ4_ZIZPA|nr:hypothetical protein GUJ93_ZPchr0001g30852 [Zizania palustris]
MEMQEYCCYGIDVDVDVDWFPSMVEFTPPCSWPAPAPAASPLVVRSVRSNMSIALVVFPKQGDAQIAHNSYTELAPSFIVASDHGDVLQAAGEHGALGIGGSCSAANLVLMREDEMPGYLPIPPPVADDGHYIYQQLQVDHLLLSPLPAAATDGAMAGHDDDLLMLPFTDDIDLDSFVVDDDLTAIPTSLDAAIVPAGGRHSGNHQNACHDMELHTSEQQDTAHGGAGAGALVVHDDSLSMVGASATGYEMGVRSYTEQKQQARGPLPVAMAPPPHLARSRDGSAPAAGRTRLDHIGFEDLRRYFYMPITRAAREMNVGLTVLKKRCRELGVARWPHRKMKSLKSLILNVQACTHIPFNSRINRPCAAMHGHVYFDACMVRTCVQEMGSTGLSAAAMRQELAALEKCCAMMEQNPAVELTERTKKLRQACFKENYKRRRAAGVVGLLDHCFSFEGHYHHHQEHFALPLPAPDTAGHHIQLRRGFVG